MSILALVVIALFFATFFIYAPADLARLAHEQVLDELWDDESVDAVPNLTERLVADVPGSGANGVAGGRSALWASSAAAGDHPLGEVEV